MNNRRTVSYTLTTCSFAVRTAVASLFAMGLGMGGCSSTESVGSVDVIALGAKPLLFETDFLTSAYVVKDSEDSFWFSTVPFDALLAHEQGTPLKNAVFLHAQLVWTPKPGLTPLDSTATNLVTRLIVVSDGEVALYGGAAFARPSGEPGTESMELEIAGGTLTMLAKTKGFNDLISPAGLSGTLSAPYAPENANRWRRSLSQFVTNALGESMWVFETKASPRMTLVSR